MSILADPLLLATEGEAHARLLPEGAQGGVASVSAALTVAVYWGVAAALWIDHPLARPLRRAFGYRSGREFMLRFPLPERSRRDARRNAGRDHAILIAALATYPLWWRLGWDHGRRARPHGA